MQHTPGPMTTCLCGINYPDGHLANCVKVDATTAPHSCDAPGCPGPENLRKLEAVEKLIRVVKSAMFFIPSNRQTPIYHAIHAYEGASDETTQVAKI